MFGVQLVRAVFDGKKLVGEMRETFGGGDGHDTDGDAPSFDESWLDEIGAAG